MEKLVIRGARQHNLKNITLELPKNTLIVFTGLSGSGKSSLAFDTIYAEGQRRYVESLSAYARQFLGVMDKPDVDAIEGLSPAISIDQKSRSHNPRSTVGTVTEIYDYLRLLFARIGHPHCPNCGGEIRKLSSQEIVDRILTHATDALKHTVNKYVRLLVLAPVVFDRKGEFVGLFDNLRAKGYRTVRVDGKFFDINEDLILIKTNKHTIEAVIDRLTIEKKYLRSPTIRSIRSRVSDAVEQSLNLSDGRVIVCDILDSGFTIPEKPKKVTDHLFSQRFACPVCNIALPEIEPRTFSFNSPHGACPECSGIGTIVTVDERRILSPELSMTEGGILPFAKMFVNDTWYARLITHVARELNIDSRAPLKRLTVLQKKSLLYGTGDRTYRISGKNRFGEETSISEPFTGIIPELKRRHSETESDYMRIEIEKYMRQEICGTCSGKRLKKESLTITINESPITHVTAYSIRQVLAWVQHIAVGNGILTENEGTIAAPIFKEVRTRLAFLVSVGLDYLTLDRSATTLAGGEAQRIRLASQIGSGLSGVLYVLDEPSIGLHPRDNRRLINTLKRLRDLGNTVIVVEHDREMIESADHVVDFGPGAGDHGGSVIHNGSVMALKRKTSSLTGQYLNGKRTIKRLPKDVTSYSHLYGAKPNGMLTLFGARHNNLKNITVQFPFGKLICITGVSGSGKSSLVVETLYPALAVSQNPMSKQTPGIHNRLDGTVHVDKVILIDQSPIGRTPRSNPATYTGLFTPIRELFAMLPQSKELGFTPGRFSFNVRGGRCEACEGEGQIRIEMQFLSDVYVTCDVCHGSRYDAETLTVSFHGKDIAQVLDMTVEESREFFTHHPKIYSKLQTLLDVGLGYIHLGQPAPTLSGGEAQRVKLATELSKRATGKTIYILDEPTTGLHFADLEKLLHVLLRLTNMGNTVIVIEHNLDVVKNADWIIDLGPEGGDEGGFVIGSGTPAELARNTRSHTGQILANVLE